MHEDQHDQAIEDVLHALRTTEPPQGYESRIHNALLQASMATSHPQRSAAKSKDLLASLLPKLPWAAACAALLILGIVVRSYTHHEKPHNTPAVAHSNAPSPQPAIVVTRTPAPLVTQRTQHAAPKQEQQADTQPQRIEVAIQTHEYIPEPPLPLTEQERMVRRMTRRNDAQQLADYTPDARARQLHEDAQAYHDYFAATSLDGQPIYVQHIDHPQLSGGTK